MKLVPVEEIHPILDIIPMTDNSNKRTIKAEIEPNVDSNKASNPFVTDVNLRTQFDENLNKAHDKESNKKVNDREAECSRRNKREITLERLAGLKFLTIDDKLYKSENDKIDEHSKKLNSFLYFSGSEDVINSSSKCRSTDTDMYTINSENTDSMSKRVKDALKEKDTSDSDTEKDRRLNMMKLCVDLPTDSEISKAISLRKNSRSDITDSSESDPEALEICDIIFKRKKRKNPHYIIDLTKDKNVNLPEKISTRERKPTHLREDVRERARINNILKSWYLPKPESDIDPDIVGKNLQKMRMLLSQTYKKEKRKRLTENRKEFKKTLLSKVKVKDEPTTDIELRQVDDHINLSDIYIEINKKENELKNILTVTKCKSTNMRNKSNKTVGNTRTRRSLRINMKRSVIKNKVGVQRSRKKENSNLQKKNQQVKKDVLKKKREGHLGKKITDIKIKKNDRIKVNEEDETRNPGKRTIRELKLLLEQSKIRERKERLKEGTGIIMRTRSKTFARKLSLRSHTISKIKGKT